MQSRKCLCTGLLSVLMIAGVGTTAALAQVEKVGELEPLSIGTSHPYFAKAGEPSQEWVIRHSGATYIRVHFSAFDLAPGDALVIASPDGLDRNVYTGLGPHGTSEFWAFAVPGDTAVLTLQSSLGGGYGFEVDSFGRGHASFIIPPSEPVVPESVCGTQDWRDVKCYEASRPTEYEKARGTVKALIGCCSSCTAFKVSDSGQFMTNNHCTSSQSGVQSTQLQFEYQMSGCGSGSTGSTGAVMGSSMLATNSLYDYTLFTTTGNSSAIPCLELDNRLPPNGERIYIPGHPSGGPKKLSIESTHASNPTGLCEVDASPYSGNGADTDVGYYCDTTNGSSGSPVLSGDTHKVVALHHFGGCLNSGGRIDRIYSQISGLLDACSGGGGGGTCGDGVIDAGEDCDGSNLGGQTCQSQGFGGGTLACTSGCQFDTSGCVAACDPPGAACTTNGECCSNSCKGKPGSKTCK